ncbi:glycosyltransferase [Viridibacterium curvum]|uniref:NodB homology domain-containing protein n=1 Tax=Viridibacterium curvum TaxID=1101404 RepID=A0ABP9QET2_9RHOO
MRVLQSALSSIFGGGADGALSVLSFHRIPVTKSPHMQQEFDLEEFERILDVLEEECRVLPLDEALDALSRGVLPDRAVALTLDDGYADWREGVVPALYQRGLPATFFIACGQLSGQLLWYERFRTAISVSDNLDALKRVFGDLKVDDVWKLPAHDRPFALERVIKYVPSTQREEILAALEALVGVPQPEQSVFLSEADVRAFASMGFSIGAHTFTHPILSRCQLSEARDEIAGSKEYLEGVIKGKVSGFAYPNGKPLQDFDASHVELVRQAGYRYAVSTERGVATRHSARFAIPRFGPWSSGKVSLLRHLAMNRFEKGGANAGAYGEALRESAEPVLSEPSVAAHVARAVTSAPTVSVVIPVYNCFDLLGEAIDSVLAQQPLPMEIIVVNDGSSDGDYQEFARRYPLVRVIDKPNSGVSASRNLAVREARGDLIAFLDADDVWLPGKLAAQLKAFEDRPDAGVVFGRFEKWFADSAGNFKPWREFGAVPDDAGIEPERSGWLFGKLMMGLLVGMNTAVVRRDLLLASGGFDEKRKIGEDYELWLRLSRETPMLSIRNVVALYRMRAGSAMHGLRDKNELAALLEEIRERWGLEGPHFSGVTDSAFRKRLAQVHFEHGYNHVWRGARRVAHQSFVAALGNAPRNSRARLYAVLTRTPLTTAMIRWVARRS